jgi:PAS domain S-box-containing protein
MNGSFSISRMTRVAGALAAFVGLSVLTGWALGTPWLEGGFGGETRVNPASALLYVLAGFSLWTLVETGSHARALRAGTTATLALMLAAALVLTAPLLGLAPGIDLLPWRSRLAALGASAPKPLSGGSAIVYLLIGAALLLVRGRREGGRLLGRSVGLLFALLATLTLLVSGYRRLSGTASSAGSTGLAMLVGLAAIGIGLASAGTRAPEVGDTREPGALRGKVNLVLGVAVAMLILICGLSIWSTARSLRADAFRKASLQRRVQLAALYSALQAGESAQHAYVLTGDPGFLPPYRAALEQLPLLRAEAGADSVQARRLAALNPLVGERLAQLTRTMQLRDAGRLAQANAIVRSAEGRQLMEQLRAGIAGMTAEEDSLAARWDGQVRTATRISLLTDLLAGLLVVCFLILAGRTISRDFRERIRIEAERDRFFTLSLDLLCVASADGYFKRLNPAFSTTLGWSVEELLSVPFIDFVHPDDREATLREVARQTIAGEPVIRFENRYRHQDGSWRILSWRSVPQPDGLMFATARDVTDVHQAQEILRAAKESADVANRAKSDFLAKMSHELRTPLNSIIGFSEILEAESVGPLSDKQHRYVANVLLSGRNLLQLINDILDLSKVEAGRMELLTAPLAVEEAIAQARELVGPLADKKGLQLDVAVAPALPPLLADPAKFKQIMLNLLSNAIKFTPEGGRVGMSARLLPGSGNGAGPLAVEVAVSDTGIGIAPENLERIFKEFEQVGSDPLKNSEGTGLGLALTRKLVQLHGGRVWVESTPGLGSIFRFSMPCAPVRPAAAPGSAPAGEDAATARPLVLVVDDDAKARDLITHYLEHSGYRALGAATGMEAVGLALALQPAAITLDVILPDRDGLMVLAQLKTNPETRRIPVVVVSITERSELGFSLGASDWLVKPVQQEVFLRALETATAGAGAAPCTVLLVDDDPATLEYLSELVLQRGGTVLCGANGRDGVALARAHRPDAIIMDLAMPVMNGFEAVRLLREDRLTRDIPILVVTARDLTPAERRRLQSSVQGIVSKGWHAELLTELARLLPVSAGASA